MDNNTANNIGMYLTNAAQEFYNVANNHAVGDQNEFLREYNDFTRTGSDIEFTWHDNGMQKSLSLNQVYDFINGGVADQITQLLETVSNLEERLESMEFYGNDNAESA